ncbi:MAG TPA: sulfatase-like hydrolase/transferase [Clostridia bacterium]|nr:sulfatase-like hydrolase/transferase [Clostridia bacterium]
MRERDNVLLITTDQQRFDTIQALGNGTIFTPHLNYMISEGIAYTRCYADCPVCVPSRTTLMTGLRGYESGILANQSHTGLMSERTAARKTLPALLTDAGYQTRAVGKMHFEPARAHYGFESMELPLDYMRLHDKNRREVSPKRHGLGECPLDPVVSTVSAKDSITAWTMERTLDFLETRDPLRPFFLWTSFTKPHPPMDPPMDYWMLYDTDAMPDPIYGDWSQTLSETPQGFLAGSYVNTDVHLHSPRQMRAVKRAYYALITQVDYALGLLFGCMREQKLFQNTWIVFTSDHGEMLGDHHLSQKNLFFEGAAHVPLIVVPPKKYDMPRNRRVDTLAELADLFPTLLHMAGVPCPEEAKGINLLELRGEDRPFYGNTLDSQLCVMLGGLKLVYSRLGGHYLLFNLRDDPMEQRDLYRLPEWQEAAKALRQELLDFVARTAPHLLADGDFIVLPEPAFPGDVPGRWLGFHYKDYSIDTFH